MLRLNGYYATPIGNDSNLSRLTDDMVFFSASSTQCLPMTLFCDYYDIAPKELSIDQVLFNRWGTSVKIKKLIKNSNVFTGEGTVMFFNLDSDGCPDKTEVAVYREQAEIDIRSTYVSPENLVFG